VVRFSLYRDHIGITFINDSREYFFDWKASSNEPVPDRLRAVMFSDGDMSEVESTVANTAIYDDNNIIRGKHNPKNSMDE